MDGSINQFPEQEARDNIDKQLRAAGWAVQDKINWNGKLKYLDNDLLPFVYESTGIRVAEYLTSIFAGNSLIISPQSKQRSQSSTIPATAYETAPPPRRGTRMTQIGRIFTDLRFSIQIVISITR